MMNLSVALLVRVLAPLVGLPAGFAENLVHVVLVGHCADRGHAGVQNHAELARPETDLGVAAITAHQLGVGAGGAGHLAALQGLQLDIVDDRADRQTAQRGGVARLHVDLLGSDDLVTDLQALRGQDIGQLAVGVLDQGDEGRPVRIVLQALNGRDDVPLATLEVDHAVEALGAAAAEADRDTATAATTARLGQTFDQRLLRAALVELAAVDQHKAAATGRRRIVMLQSHLSRAPS